MPKGKAESNKKTDKTTADAKPGKSMVISSKSNFNLNFLGRTKLW